MPKSVEAYILVGPTAAGKSAVAHLLAQRHQRPLLSADSMLIYKGMDIGTAKPEPDERVQVDYYGLDLVTPAERYSTGDYYEYVHHQNFAKPVVITGGTGLYVKTLLYGMDDVSPENPEIRALAEQLLATGGQEALKEYARQKAPERFRTLKDPSNPRRVIRMLEQQACGLGPVTKWEQAKKQTVVGLNWEREDLKKRILWRIDLMYNDGLLEEAECIRRQYPVLSETACQAIGYREAFAVLDGLMSEKDAREQTAIRTRRLAKRQMTWFRNQLDVQWVDVCLQDRIEQIAQKVEDAWEEIGYAVLAE